MPAKEWSTIESAQHKGREGRREGGREGWREGGCVPMLRVPVVSS
jgi:hypothetical protein